jgi:hypothetical protein
MVEEGVKLRLGKTRYVMIEGRRILARVPHGLSNLAALLLYRL